MYGPMFVIFILSFQGPEGGLTFPMRGVSLHRFRRWPKGWAWWTLARRCGALAGPGVAVMLCTVVVVGAGRAGVSQAAGGRQHAVFIVVASLIMPSIIVSLGIGLEFRLIDNGIKAAPRIGWAWKCAGELRHVARPVHPAPGRAPDGRCRLACSSCLRCSTASTLAYEEAARPGRHALAGLCACGACR